MKMIRSSLLILTTAILMSGVARAQIPVSLELPRVSPKETRSITIGFTTIGFEYSSVGVKGREIWGGVVPYGEIWRTGANENTVFSVTDDVLINGEPLKAGEYAMFTIPEEDSWTLIFSEFSEAWGSFFYKQEEDALRIKVTPEEMNSTYEWMKFSFENYTDTSVDMSLKWAGLKIPFTVEIPREVTFRHIEDQFRTLPAFSWQGWVQGASYLLNNNYMLDKALSWAQRATQIEENVQTQGLYAKLLVMNDRKDEGLKMASGMTKRWTDNWRSHYSAAEVYEVAGEIAKAKESYKKAIETAENERTKTALQRRLDALNNK